MIYRIGRFLCNTLMHFLFRMEVQGLEYIPTQGPVLVCSNHTSWWDILAVGGPVVHRKLHFMAKMELFKAPFFGWLLDQLGAFPVNRGRVDRHALRASLEVLEQGKAVAIFPEGTRVHTAELGRAKAGAAFMALHSDAAVVPVGVSSSYKLFSKVKVCFGPPLDMAAFRVGRIRSADLERLSQEIMERISTLVDTKLRIPQAAP